uniref:Uncharacterized protein n=1 Tax=Melopsittacus undulatus TaxID=13146 RepID=A0A8C6JAC2_MELUD
MPEPGTISRLRLSGLCFLLQTFTILLFAAFVRFSPESSPGHCSQPPNCSRRYPSPGFRDVHLQTLLGFGFLVAFLSRSGPGSVATSILVLAFAIQWALLLQGFLHHFQNGKIHMGAQSMVHADFGAAAALISTGAVLGRVNPAQMLVLTLLGVTLFTLNEYILLSLLGVSDSGGSVTVHTFGAYFGLLVSRMLRQPHGDQWEEQQDTGHPPDVFAVVGTICLWIFWPSFTTATSAHGSAEPWALLNTYFSMAASTMATFVLSPVLYDKSTLHMVQIQDATVAGAAVMGMAGEMLVTPFGALIAGFLAGLIPPLGFRFLTPFLHSRLNIQDTCGVHNVHGLPGVLGALLGTLLAGLATADAYGGRLELVFPQLAGGGRSRTEQALLQLSALLLSLLLAGLGGCLTGELCLGQGRGQRPRRCAPCCRWMAAEARPRELGRGRCPRSAPRLSASSGAVLRMGALGMASSERCLQDMEVMGEDGVRGGGGSSIRGGRAPGSPPPVPPVPG